MTGKTRVPFMNPDGSTSQETGTLMNVKDSKEPWTEYTLEDGSSNALSANDLENLYFNMFIEKVAPLFNKAIKNLLNARNYLALQLDFECGNISEEYFDKEESKYLTEAKSIPINQLYNEAKLLLGFSNIALDSLEISEILGCSVDDAEKILKHLASEV